MAPISLPKNRVNQTFLGRIKKSARARKIPFEITLGQLSQRLNDQLGLCRYTGLELTFDPKGGVGQTASLDRIDSSEAYHIDNVDFVHKTVNLMKHTMSPHRFIFLAGQVCEPMLSVRYEILEHKRRPQFRGAGVISGEFLGYVRTNAIRRGISFDLTCVNLNELFYKQLGICAATGLILVPKEYKKRSVGNLSIDRIDPAAGYEPGNIRLVISEANYMRGQLTLVDFNAWCSRIARWNDFINSDEFDYFYDRRKECLALD